MSSPLLEFSFSSRAIAGSRPYQEDTSRVWRPNSSSGEDRPLLAVLADGMGGHVSGEVASRLAAEQYINAFSSEHGNVDQRLEHALYAGNDAILNAVLKEKNLNGMGCTLVASYIDQEGLRWVSVGDSLLLLYRDHTLIRKNESHSLGALLDMHAEANVITEEEARNSPRRHTLRSALTGAPIPLKEIEPRAHPLRPGDWIIMASDGLETLSGDAIAQIISEHEHDNPDEVAQALLSRVTAEGHPNQDNTTVVVIRVQDPTLLPTRIVTSFPGHVPPSEASSGSVPAGVLAAPAAGRPSRTMTTSAKLALVAVAAGFVGMFVAWLTSGGGGSGQKEVLKSPESPPSAAIQQPVVNEEKPPAATPSTTKKSGKSAKSHDKARGNEKATASPNDVAKPPTAKTASERKEAEAAVPTAGPKENEQPPPKQPTAGATTGADESARPQAAPAATQPPEPTPPPAVAP